MRFGSAIGAHARHRRLVRRAAAGLLALALGCAAGSAGASAEVPIGGVLRDVPMNGLNGPPRRLSEYRGRPLFINVWASWCGPCISEMASIERLAWREGRIPFAVIGISTDDYPGDARAFLQRSHASVSHFIDHAQVLEDMLGAKTIPLTVLVGSDGRVLDKHYGALEWDTPEALAWIAHAFARERRGAQREQVPASGAGLVPSP